MNGELEERRFSILEAQITNLIREQENIHVRLEELIILQEQILSVLQNIENNTKPKTF